MSKPRGANQPFLVTMPMGLDGVTVDELKRSLPDAAVADRQSTELRLTYPGPAADLTSLRSITDAWVVARDLRGLGPRYRDLRLLGEQLAKVDLSPAIDVLRSAGFRPKRTMTFMAVCTMRDKRAYRRLDALKALEEAAFIGSHGRLRPGPNPADLRLWLHLWQDQARLCLALSPKPVGLRQRPVSLPTSLPGPVAYAMAALTKPRPEHFFVDLMCGSGSIALERAENWRHRLLLAGDSSWDAIRATAANFGPRHRPRDFLIWDATALPLAGASVDALACNPPHGVQMQPAEGLERLYQGLLSEAARVLRPFAIMTLLTPQRPLVDRLLRRMRHLRLEHCFVIDLLGQRPYLYVLRRNA